MRELELLHDVITRFAGERGDAPALIQASSGLAVTWREFDEITRKLAGGLARAGLKPGDIVATRATMTLEHVLFEYACFRLGLIHSPLDLRLTQAEIERSLAVIRPAAFVFLGDFPVMAEVPRWWPFAAAFTRLLAEGATHAGERFDANHGAQIIFTTGSTGSPKAALLSHRNILFQNVRIGGAFGFGSDTRLLMNLPASHVGGQAEALMTTLFLGGTAVLLEVFDAARSLEAIERYRIDKIGQIPAMFQMEWRHSNYAQYDLSSLDLAIYGGQQVSRPFIEKLATMAPKLRTGLGLTEAAGFCTYTRPEASIDDLVESIGFDDPGYPMTIRRPMAQDGSAGEEVPDGETAHVCFRGPQTFLGYLHNEEATRRTISSDGWLYTGDLGFRDAKGLHFAGRAKWVIKPRGYQVFPGDVESHFVRLAEQVAGAAAIGVEHEVFSEAIVLFVEKKPDSDIDVAVLRQHARGIASFMRPLHYVIVNANQLPLNRVGKTDYVRLEQMAQEEVD
ncbi:MAG: class I adenylate-forming enzyme family protein, partial [Acidobacteria bacterium]|nr:class I adenylate-forming enzyme family protein [Acidobacteriota bacterium]